MKLYLVCEECGEAFDSFDTTKAHPDSQRFDHELFFIRTEEEAM